jgi:predicted O-methyltransferase YrrM
MTLTRRVGHWLFARAPVARVLFEQIRPAHRRSTTGVPALPNTVHLEDGNQWYEPLVAGPSTFLADVVGARAVRGALDVLTRLSGDRYMDFLINYYRRGLSQFGEDWVYADLNTVLYGLSRRLGADRYLEIGVRRGMSMAMVASQRPRCDIAGFDLWIENYAGMANPGEDLVRDQLRRVAYQGAADFIAGDSKTTIPAYFRSHPDRFYDLVTVDGNHSRRGASADIVNVIPRLRCGGALVFDDICNPAHRDLEDVWQRLVVKSERFAAYSFTELGFGVGFAIKKS